METASVTSAYTWALITMILFFLIAILSANMVPYKPNDPGTSKRRVCFWILCVLSVVVGFFINFAISSGIGVPTIKSSYMLHTSIAAGISLVLFIILGFAISKMFPTKKVGTWF